MKNLTLENITVACKGTFYGPEEEKKKEVAGVFIDSRKVIEDSLFIPIRGERVDGHDFIPSVFEKGAAAVLSEQELEAPKGPYILVESTATALKDIARFYLEGLDVKVVGISGSVGKTSTKEMISSVLEEKYKVLKTAGNYNNEIGLPLTIFNITEEHEVAVLEMGISDFNEMHRLAAISQPDICVITNIGQCHLENLKTRDGILQAKTEMFDHMQKDGFVILNGDDDKLSTVEQVNGKRPYFYGVGASNDAYAEEMENLGLLGMKALLHIDGVQLPVTIPIPGEHNVYNALAAACVGKVLGLTLEEIQRGIETVETIAGRTNLLKIKDMIVIDDCYNANPVSMKASLDVLSKGEKRKIAVLGDMGELGEKEAELHLEVGAYAGSVGIDVVFCTGTLARNYKEGIAERIPCYYYEKREEMVEALLSYVEAQDTILVKASHFMEFPKVVEALKEKA